LKKDDCSDGDNSPSYYDKTCNANVGTGQALSDDGTSSNENANVDNAHVVSTEIVNAYEWALQH
jgi:hypothetical protein